MAEQLFNRTLAVTVKSSDRDDSKRVHIKITVEIQTTTTPLHRKDLVVHLTDDRDPYFLYSLSIGEEDFQSLKSQQGLLVDFTAFPQKFIDLLELCLQEESKDSPKFLLQLVTSGGLERGLAHLDVVETNPFKHLTHLSLKFIPGNDSDVKKYLATRLKKLKEEKGALENRLAATESELSHRLKQTQEALSERTVELDSMRAEWTSKASNLTAKHAQEVSAHKEKALQVQNDYQQKYEKDRKELEETHHRISEQLERRLAELEAANKDLTDHKYRSESSIREFQARNQSVSEECDRVKEELQNLRRQNTSLDTECHDRDKSVNQLRMRVAVLEQEVKDKDQVIARTTDLLEASQEQKRKLEESVDQKTVQCNKLEKTVRATSDEVVKGNEIIKRLQGDLKGAMAKIKLKNTVTTQQEKLLSEKERQVEKQIEELRILKENLKIKEEENKKLSESLENTMQKLEESKQLLKTNENVINWLNKQVNESQMHRQGAFEIPSTTSSFKPTINPPSMLQYSSPGMNHSTASHLTCSSATSGGSSSSINTVVNLRQHQQPLHHHYQQQPSHSAVSSVRHRQPHQTQLQVHYNPLPVRRSGLPVPMTTGPSSVPAIPEELSPTVSKSSSPASDGPFSKDPAPVIDSKYLTKKEDVIVVRGLKPQPMHAPSSQGLAPTLSQASHTITPPMSNPLRLSQAGIVPKLGNKPVPTQPPLMSAYFPASQNQQIQAQS